MKSLKCLPSLLLGIAAAGLPPAVTAAQPTDRSQAAAPVPRGSTLEELRSEAKTNLSFGVRLYKQLANNPGNVFISPVGIGAAFGPVALGARADTYRALERTLGFRPDPRPSSERLGGLLRALRTEHGGEGAKLSIANALWLTDRHPVKDDFVSTVRVSFDAAVEAVDFRNSPAAAKRINAWVDTDTKGKIASLFAEDAFDDKTALVITNAVHFLGDWTQPFNAARTRTQPFYLLGGTQRQAAMMADEKSVKYFADDQLQMIDLPYKGDELSMVVILPKARDGLPALEARLSDAKLGDWLRKLDTTSPPDMVQGVFVELPKIEIQTDYDLGDPLKAMGMDIAFDPLRADFRGMSDERLHISDVVHKTFLRIDEKGTEAAAATAVVMGAERSGPELLFRADHPFLLLIRHRETGAILFFGRIVEP